MIENKLCHLSKRKIIVTRTHKSSTQRFDNTVRQSVPISAALCMALLPYTNQLSTTDNKLVKVSSDDTSDLKHHAILVGLANGGST
jgi:hypothetical protein